MQIAKELKKLHLKIKILEEAYKELPAEMDYNLRFCFKRTLMRATQGSITDIENKLREY